MVVRKTLRWNQACDSEDQWGDSGFALGEIGPSSELKGETEQMVRKVSMEAVNNVSLDGHNDAHTSRERS